MNQAQLLLHSAPSLDPRDLTARWDELPGPAEQRFLVAMALLIQMNTAPEPLGYPNPAEAARQLLRMLSRHAPARPLTGPLLLPEGLLWDLHDRLQRAELPAGVLLRWCDPFEEHPSAGSVVPGPLVGAGDVPQCLAVGSHLLREAAREPERALPLLRSLVTLGNAEPDPLIRIALWSHAATALHRSAPAEAHQLLRRTLAVWETLDDPDDKDTFAGSLLPDVHEVLGSDAAQQLAARIGNRSLRRQALFHLGWLLASTSAGGDPLPYLSAALDNPPPTGTFRDAK